MSGLEFMSALLVAAITGNGLWGLIQYMITKRDKTKSDMEQGLLAILHDRLYALAEEYIERKEITIDEFDNLTYLYTPYESMGGNGTGKELYAKCKNLPIVEKHKD